MIDDRLWSLIALGLVALGYLLCLLYPLPQVRALLRLPPPEGELRAALRQALGAPRDATDDELLLTVIQAREQAGLQHLLAGMESRLLHAIGDDRQWYRQREHAALLRIRRALQGKDSEWQKGLLDLQELLQTSPPNPQTGPGLG